MIPQSYPLYVVVVDSGRGGPYVGRPALVVGWGVTDEGDYAGDLAPYAVQLDTPAATVPLYDAEVEQRAYFHTAGDAWDAYHAMHQEAERSRKA